MRRAPGCLGAVAAQARPALARAQTLANPAWGAVAGGCHLDRDTRQTIVAVGFTVTSERSHLGGHVILLEAE